MKVSVVYHQQISQFRYIHKWWNIYLYYKVIISHKDHIYIIQKSPQLNRSGGLFMIMIYPWWSALQVNLSMIGTSSPCHHCERIMDHVSPLYITMIDNILPYHISIWKLEYLDISGISKYIFINNNISTMIDWNIYINNPVHIIVFHDSDGV